MAPPPDQATIPGVNAPDGRRKVTAPEDLATLALAFATDAHDGQVDRFGRPFIEHPKAVAELSSELGDLATTIAYLHDTVEKAAADPADIERTFGGEVRRMVETLGQDLSIPDPDGRRIDHRARVSAAGPVERAVYLNDRRDGIRTMTALVAGGRAAAEFGGRDRLYLWKGDLEALDPDGLDPGLLRTARAELAKLESLLD